MNVVLIAVLLILAATIIIGYWRGFIRIAFSLVSMIVLIVLVSWLTPYITGFLKGNTDIYDKLVQGCTQRIQVSVEERIRDSIEEEPKGDDMQSDSEGDSFRQILDKLPIPKVWEKQLLERTGAALGHTIEESGIYRQAGEYVADWILQGISFFVAYILISMLLRFAVEILDIIAKLPLIKGVNQILGGVAGLLQGLLIVWLFMFLIAIACTSQIGQIALGYIKESSFLTFLYENNGILYLLYHIFGI